MALKVPDSPITKTQVYSDLMGVDFSQDASLVDRRHSPDMLNMISDDGGSPVKRNGWHILGGRNAEDTEMLNLCHFEYGGDDYFIMIYREGQLYRAHQFYADGSVADTRYNVTANINASFFMTDKYYLFCADRIYTCTPSSGTITFAEITPKIPTIIINRDPTDGGGNTYEEVNLLTNQRTEMFYDPAETVAGAKTQFLLTATSKTAINITDYTVQYLDANGDWQTDNTATIIRTKLGTTYTYKAKITTGHAHPGGGESNIKITYAFGDAGAAKIRGCTNYAFYSHGGLDQVFITGNPDYPNYIWYSGVGDPTYFPDLNYMTAGSAGTKCMGFLNIGENLAVVKESSEQDSAIFFIYETSLTSKAVTVNTADGSETETTQEYAYAIKRATGGIGAVSKNCFKILQDEPLFLSETGVQGIVSTNTTSEKVVRNRSAFLNKKLLAEPNLKDAISCVSNGYYYIFINNHVYILDSRHTAADRRGNTSYSYESYYWENVPASCVCVANGTIYFGTSDGKLCKFKNTGQMTDYSDGSYTDNSEYVDGEAIHARYATRNDDDDAPQYFKTMMKKGTMCTVAPFASSSVSVFIQADSTPTSTDILAGQQDIARYYIGTYFLGVGSIFPEVDFTRLFFDARTGPRDYFFRKKKKKYIRLQIILENAELNEGFGVYHIVKTYSLTRYAK